LNSKITSIIQLIKNDEVFYTIETENVYDYKFRFDSKLGSELYLAISNMNMNDLDVLVKEPYESYVLIGSKRIGNKSFPIPARVFKRMLIKESDNKVKITFSE